jgi:hypothetical protein
MSTAATVFTDPLPLPRYRDVRTSTHRPSAARAVTLVMPESRACFFWPVAGSYRAGLPMLPNCQSPMTRPAFIRYQSGLSPAENVDFQASLLLFRSMANSV